MANKSWDVYKAAKEFLTSGRLFKQWNHTLLVMVPKTENTTFVVNYKHVVYKIISKILASQLQSATISLFDPAQATFVEDCLIVKNIHLAQELLRKYARKRIT